MTERVRRLRDEMAEWTDAICPHRARIVTEAYQRNEACPTIIKRARALRDVLERMPIYLRAGDLIVGTPTSTPGAWIAYPEFSLGTESIVQMRHNFSLPETFTRDGLPPGVVEYWETRNLYARYCAMRREAYGEETMPPENWYQLGTALGHVTADFAEVLDRGLEGTVERAARRRDQIRDDDPEAVEFLTAVIIAAEGGIVFAERYGKLCADEAAREPDAARRAELARMSEHIPRAVATGATTLWETLQSLWLCNQIMHIEGNAWSMSPGRVDLIFGSYYERDLASGELTEEQALELLQCFLMKFRENSVFGPRGNPTQSITLGGRNAAGEDQTKALTHLFLRAASELRIAEPLINLRWHDGMREELMHAALDCVAEGQNMPVFLNDEATPQGFINLGIDADAAFDYTHVGCGELGIVGKLQDSALGGSTGHIHALVQALREARRAGRPMSSFEDVLDALKATMRRNGEHSAEVARTVGYIHRLYGQIPFTSAFMHGCIERGRDLTVRAEINLPNMNLGGGFANFVNSLAAIRQVAFRDGLCDLDTLLDAMEADYEGHGELRGQLQNAPKFGNDDDDADDLISIVEAIHAEAIEGLAGPRNSGRFIASGIDGGGHLSAGRGLMATPDGRRAGEPLAPGMAAAHGTDRRGLTALLNTVQKLDGTGHWFGGYTLNIRVLPELLQRGDARDKLMAALRTYFLGGGLNLHLNCVSAEMLRDAQAHPERYADLVVRVSGYSDHFVRLSGEFQDEIIRRTEQALR